MAPKKTVPAKSTATKTPGKILIAREKERWDEGSARARLSTKRFSYHSDRFTLLCMKIVKEQNPTTFRSMHVEREAINALQKSAEKHLISVLEGVAVVAEHAGRKAPIKKDFETLESLRPYVG
ncbi:uncharacterized protein FIESC28_04980 [Fusarium coffeatum]|uniref:Histone H2A/H2B/H3 domain-containing protein n=1 Tax=Fusarium coffeatum TaxID=231269 RepID=A0A366RWI4_9HYPO|nr:uncharacterized protein FIESC28_04980 [Fusarium coffeatum]RBR21443.1 hypothetical protein FIESC28_04980 [Fusarium coffeatum]